MNIVFTGGGTAGHAMANNIIISSFEKQKEDRIFYLGSIQGAERDLIGRMDHVVYIPIHTGKLRRYPSTKTFKDFFCVLLGILESFRILKKEEVNVVFSGGGYVSFPVVVAAWLQHIPVLIRETDVSMGLANRMCVKMAKKIFTTFPSTLEQLSGYPGEYSGLLIRPELLAQNFTKKIPATEETYLPHVLVMGGSMGSDFLNHTIWDHIERLSLQFQITHLCGKGRKNPDLCAPGYLQYEYVNDMADLYAQADIIVMRCGSNAISEGLALGKRMVCIPISTQSSRGEQFTNAEFAVKNGCAVILDESTLNVGSLMASMNTVLQKTIPTACMLDQLSLHKTIRHLVHEIYLSAIQNLEHRMVSNIRQGTRINWAGLSPWETHLYEELLEQCDC